MMDTQTNLNASATDVEHFRRQLETETNPVIRARIEKQIELLEDTISMYSTSRSNINGKIEEA